MCEPWMSSDEMCDICGAIIDIKPKNHRLSHDPESCTVYYPYVEWNDENGILHDYKIKLKDDGTYNICYTKYDIFEERTNSKNVKTLEHVVKLYRSFIIKRSSK